MIHRDPRQLETILARKGSGVQPSSFVKSCIISVEGSRRAPSKEEC